MKTTLSTFIYLTFIFSILLFNLNAQQSIQGQVRDQEGKPLIGAVILEKGTNNAATSDTSGKFKLKPNKPYPLVIKVSLVGYKPAELRVDKTPDQPIQFSLETGNLLSEVVITARRREETAQDVPIPISVVAGKTIDEAGAFNVNRLKEFVPTVQLYSSNPRNTSLNIRGLGSTFGLTNDGIDPGVGFYIDGVYYARPAATTLDFLDIEQVEVLRGPQGTLFGKNTTAGAINFRTRLPSFTPGVTAEVSYGNYGFIQAKASLTGPLHRKLAARLSFSGTQRDGLLYNVATRKPVNDLNNIGLRGQLLFKPSERIKILLAADVTSQKPDGYAQVIAGVVKTQRPDYRQFNNIIADLGYALPTQNPFDRIVDHDTPWRSGNELGGVSLNADFEIGGGTLTATSAWRYWLWDPSNDRDFTGLPVLAKSQATSKHEQWSQEIRYAGSISQRLRGVIGVFAMGQDLKTDPYHIEEAGAAQWRFAQNTTSDLWKTPGLFDGFGIRTNSWLQTYTAAAFANLDWEVFDQFHVIPGIRYNYDEKKIDFNRQTYGGLQTTDKELLKLKNSVYTNQAFNTSAYDRNFSGQLTFSYKPISQINTFATVSTSYKPVGVNLGGLPTASGAVLIDLARIKPEFVRHLELGVKTNPTKNSTLNFVYHYTDIKDYQTQVQTAEVGVNRGYLANAERISVQGAELDFNIQLNDHISLYSAVAYTDGKYVSFKNAPVPLEETGAKTAFKDISGTRLPGISEWAGSGGFELNSGQTKLFGIKGKFFLAADNYFRSGFSSSPSPSQFLNISGYALLNARIGFRGADGFSFFLWTRNALNKNYFEQLLPAAGNAGQFAGVLGDPRTFGATLRVQL